MTLRNRSCAEVLASSSTTLANNACCCTARTTTSNKTCIDVHMHCCMLMTTSFVDQLTASNGPPSMCGGAWKHSTSAVQAQLQQRAKIPQQYLPTQPKLQQHSCISAGNQTPRSCDINRGSTSN
jgi:hypothetical protein